MATATTRKHTGKTWTARALELASRRNLDGAASFVGERENGARVWRVPSRSRGAVYLVTVWPNIHDVLCTCHAASFRAPCAHAGAALHAEAQRARALAQPADDFAAWRILGEW